MVPVAVGRGVADVPVERGQFVCQRGTVAALLCVPDSTARNLMHRLIASGRITARASPDKQYTVVTIVDADRYLLASGKRRTSTAHISWSPDAGWAGVTDADRKRWTKAYPGVDADRAMAAADDYLHTSGRRYRNWGKFLGRQMSWHQSHGWTVAPEAEAEKPLPEKSEFAP